MKNNFNIPAFGWLMLSAICLTLVLGGLRFALKKAGWERSRQQAIFRLATFGLLGWTSLLLVLSYHGFFDDFSQLPPKPAVAILVPLPFVLWFAFSKKGTYLLRSVPDHWLVYLQSFRIAVEILLLVAFAGGKLPVQMTFEGRNFDIITGLLALPVGYWLATRKSFARKIAIAFNIAGLLLLLNILVIAVLSMPTPLRYFMNEPSNAIIAQFPFILLPGFLVPLAYALHIFSLRRLFSTGTNRAKKANREAGEMVTSNELAVRAAAGYSKTSAHRL